MSQKYRLDKRAIPAGIFLLLAAAAMFLHHIIIPGLNDSDAQVGALCRWMTDNGLQDVPLHLSRYNIGRATFREKSP